MVGARLGTRMVVPEHADVANAIGAVVGLVRMHATAALTGNGDGQLVAHLADGPRAFTDPAVAFTAVEDHLWAEAQARAAQAGVGDPRRVVSRDVQEAEIEGRRTVIGATIRVTAEGRPRIAHG